MQSEQISGLIDNKPNPENQRFEKKSPKKKHSSADAY